MPLESFEDQPPPESAPEISQPTPGAETDAPAGAPAAPREPVAYDKYEALEKQHNELQQNWNYFEGDARRYAEAQFRWLADNDKTALGKAIHDLLYEDPTAQQGEPSPAAAPSGQPAGAQAVKQPGESSAEFERRFAQLDERLSSYERAQDENNRQAWINETFARGVHEMDRYPVFNDPAVEEIGRSLIVGLVRDNAMVDISVYVKKVADRMGELVEAQKAAYVKSKVDTQQRIPRGPTSARGGRPAGEPPPSTKSEKGELESGKIRDRFVAALRGTGAISRS